VARGRLHAGTFSVQKAWAFRTEISEALITQARPGQAWESGVQSVLRVARDGTGFTGLGIYRTAGSGLLRGGWIPYRARKKAGLVSHDRMISHDASTTTSP